MPRIRDIASSIRSACLHLGGGASGSKAPDDPELDRWKKQGAPSENRADAVKAIEGAEKFKRPRVDLSRMALESLPAAVSRLTAATELHLNGNQLSAWPGEIAPLANLKDLNISFNRIVNIPAGIGSLTQLKTLNASSNYIQVMDRALSGLRNLRELDLSRNQLREFPAEILAMPKLKKLALAENGIDRLPATDRMYDLKELDLSRNPLGAIADGIAGTGGVKLPAGLKKLMLAETQLEDIPASAALPEHLGSLQELKHLDVSSNPLLHLLPVSFGPFRRDGSGKVTSTARAVPLSALHAGTTIVSGLEEGGRLRGRSTDEDTSASGTSGADAEGRQWRANAARQIRRRNRQAQVDAANGNGLPVGTGINQQQTPSAHHAEARGVQQAVQMPFQMPIQMPFQMPFQMQATAQATSTQATSHVVTSGPTAAAAVTPEAQASGGGPQGQTTAAGQASQPPAMPFPPPAFGLQSGSAGTPAAWLTQLGMETYIAQLRAAWGMPPQQPASVATPFGAGLIQQSYGAAAMPQATPFAQYAATPAWAAPQAAAPVLPSAVYEGRHFDELQKQNFDIVRNQQAQEVCSTIPPLLPEAAINERVMKIKAEEYALRRADHETRQAINLRLINLGRGLYRQQMVDKIAQQEALNRADPRLDARSLSIGYQAFLAEALDLPGPINDLVKRLNEGTMREDIFDGVIPLATVPTEVGRIRAQVELVETSDPSGKAFAAFLGKQKFWQAHQEQENLYLRNALYTNLSS